MFTIPHFIWLAICAVLIVGLGVISVKKKFSFKTSALIMAGVSLVSEVSKIASHMEFVNGVDPSEGMVIDAGALPLHLCSLLIFAFFYLPFCKNEKFKKYLLSLVVPISFIGAPLALLLATSGVSFAEPEPYQCFLYHACMIWFGIYLIATKQVDLGFKAWYTNLISILCLAIVMIWVNGALQMYDTNFFYVVRPPEDNLPFLNLNNGWFAYFGALATCGFVGLSLVHLPFIIKEKKQNASKEFYEF